MHCYSSHCERYCTFLTLYFFFFFFGGQKFQINDTSSGFDRCRLRQLDDRLCEQVVTK